MFKAYRVRRPGLIALLATTLMPIVLDTAVGSDGTSGEIPSVRGTWTGTWKNANNITTGTESFVVQTQVGSTITGFFCWDSTKDAATCSSDSNDFESWTGKIDATGTLVITGQLGDYPAKLSVDGTSISGTYQNRRIASHTGTWGVKRGRTPVLGWSSWSFLRKEPTADKLEAQARAMRDSGLQKLGYTYINLDDFWYECPGPQGPNVDSYGRWVTDPSRFPPSGETNGMKVVASYIHSMGMKFGIYVTPGISSQAIKRNTSIEGTPYTAAQIANPSVKENNYNCEGMVRIDYRKPGAQEFINSWVKLLTGWGIDYIKIDGMQNSNAPDVEAWSKAISKSGRPIILDVTQGSFTVALAPTLMKYADQWEFAPDIECYRCQKGGSSYPLTSWKDVSNRFDFVADWQPYAGSGRFNDYDSIEIGNGSDNGITPVERQTQLSLWALGAAPLILGVDLTNLDQGDLQTYLKNREILAVDQDSIAAKRILNHGDEQVFAKTESNGDAIVGLFNLGKTQKQISIKASAAGLLPNKGGYSTTNLWTGESKKTSGDVDAVVPPHGVVVYRLKVL